MPANNDDRFRPASTDPIERELRSWLSNHDDVEPGFEDEFRSALYAAFHAIPGVEAPPPDDAPPNNDPPNDARRDGAGPGSDNLLASAYFGIATARMLVSAERAANAIRETSSPIHPEYDRLRSIADDLDGRRRALEFGLRALTGGGRRPS